MMSLTQDQFRFLVANLAGLTLALPYKYVPQLLRNEYNYVPGILMVYYCFGRQANTLMLYSAISFILCRFTPKKYVQRVTLCNSLAFLSYAHLSRQILDYGGYVLDISGPFMIAVQKMTSLGFCLYDGHRLKIERNCEQNNEGKEDIDDTNNNMDDDCCKKRLTSSNSPDSEKLFQISKQGNRGDRNQLTEEQRKYAVTKCPNFSEFMGYFFHFPSVLCGPIMYFSDYSDFVHKPKGKETPPGGHRAMASKLTISITCTLLHLFLSPKFEIGFLRSPGFLVHTPLVMRFYYILIFTYLSRLKYYVAWHLGEAISNASGFGFNGYDSQGKPKWNLISNMELWRFETCLSFRDAIHAWNKTTQSWLRRTAYERAPKRLALLATYVLSAVWHGFYPGYYMTFLGGALFTYSSRVGRKTVRPFFQRGTVWPKIYDVLTFILTRLTIAYISFPFVILDYRNNYMIYKSLYFSLHIIGIVGVLFGLVSDKVRK